MPVPTDTFRDIRKLNLIFLVSAMALVAATMGLVIADYWRSWRDHQRQGKIWEVAITEDAQRQATSEGYQQALAQLERQREELTASLPHETIAKLEAELAELQAHKAAETLPMAVVKGEITPKLQQIERASLEQGEDSEQVRQLRKELDAITSDYNAKARAMAQTDSRIHEVTEELRSQRARVFETEKKLAELNRNVQTLQEKLMELAPTGLAQLSAKVRNAPLMDWFNPSEKVHQVVVPGIRTDLNFVTVETVDRCVTCHVNIDKPAFEEHNVLAFLERQVASNLGHDTSAIVNAAPKLDFWENAVRSLDEQGTLQSEQQRVLEQINNLRSQAGLEPLADAAALQAEFDRIALRERGQGEVTRSQWYEVLVTYQDDLRDVLHERLGEEEFGQLEDLYRYELVDQYNRYRSEQGLSPLSPSRVLLAHPNLSMYVDPESKHPMKTMGCTSCHDGSGQETDFHLAAHTPREVWVDADNGALIPRFLIEKTGPRKQLDRQLAGKPSGALEGVQLASAGDDAGGLENITLASAAAGAAPGHAAGEATAVYSHSDVNLNQPGNPAPFAPEYEQHNVVALYATPSDKRGIAVRQADYWAEKYQWHPVHYMEWEKPMHSMEYIESSCNRCHTEIYDLKEAAPTLFQGRQLFTQLGCANCHVASTLEDDLDVKKVGPSLVHVKHKMSHEMLASWIWAPKAFRPTTRMPHLFMLENNSSPLDIARTRVEVAAITHYLLNEPVAESRPRYEPEPVPTETGDVDRGHLLFNQLGCLACHTNLADTGEQLVVGDLVKRMGLSKEEATAQYQAMSYNQQHQYVLQHVPEKITLVGPELSGVGTKLTANRSPEEARQWLYNWLRNPQHYSSYSIMPSFRLSETEASDLTAYLLSLERPNYQPADFLHLDSGGQEMLHELVIKLKAGAGPRQMAEAEIADWNQDQKLTFLGQKMIGNYGCNACHDINGFEASAPVCATLDDWGAKDPHKLDFGYFDHAFDHAREKPVEVWKVASEGLEADAPSITAESPKVKQVEVRWEDMELERRPWLYHKLHNTRVYDRARYPNPLEDLQGVKLSEAMDEAKPYDKLKMPKFFLRDEQVRALVTFVTSLRKPLVQPELQKVTDEAGQRVIRGRQVATLYNCYGCHSIEGDEPHILQFFETMPDGSHNPNGYKWAPPRLLGQGAKTQPAWLFHFLQNVEPIRPWLAVRMPSFPIHESQASTLVDYFAGHSQMMARKLDQWKEPVDRVLAEQKAAGVESDWFDVLANNPSFQKLEEFAIKAHLATPEELDARSASPASRRDKWKQVLHQIAFLSNVYDIQYPYVEQSRPKVSAERFARGEKFITQLGCMAGNCHTVGDPDLLEQLAALDRSEEPVFEEDGYEDDGYGAEEDGYGEEEDGYGDDDSASQARAALLNKFASAPPGDPATVKAPNLGRAGYRLQRRWIESWIQEPTTFLPGTWMLSFFQPPSDKKFDPAPPHGWSQFATVSPDPSHPIRHELEAMYGYTGDQQRDLLLDFLMSASHRNYTPGAERLTGVEKAEIELKPIEPPADLPAPPAKPADAAGESSDAQAGAAATPAPVQPAKPAEPVDATTSSIELQDEATAAYAGTRVVGVVSFDGKPPRRKPVRMAADPFCGRAHKTPVFSDNAVINDQGQVRYAFVYVKSGLPAGQKFPLASKPVVDQVGCMYVPHVVGVMAGEPFTIRTDDATLHNVRITSKNNGLENFAMPVKGMETDRVFSAPELGVSFRCDVHPWMNGIVHVVDNPFFSVSDVEGRFEIVGLPPGKYTLQVVHEELEGGEIEVEVKADTSTRVDVALK